MKYPTQKMKLYIQIKLQKEINGDLKFHLTIDFPVFLQYILIEYCLRMNDHLMQLEKCPTKVKYS